MAGQEVTAQITFTRWVLETKDDMDQCCTDVVNFGSPFAASVSGRWVPAAGNTEPQQDWVLQVRDGVGRGTETGFGKVIIYQGGLLMVMTPEDAAARGYGA
jgi:hypothetical protein